jgi:hypothetical protein
MSTFEHERNVEEREGWAAMDSGLQQAILLFGDRLEAAYALGSLAHGGFAPAASDVDFALILSSLRPEDAAIVQEIGEAVKRGSVSPLAHRLSVFWSTWNSLQAGIGEGRFPLADRHDLALSGLCLFGEDRRSLVSLPPQPRLRDALVVESASFMLEKLATPERNQLIHSPDELIALGCRDVTKAVLFPARFLVTLKSGHPAGNAESVAYATQACVAAVKLLVESAYRCRVQGELDQEIPSLLRAGLLPLYDELTQAYEARLSRLGEMNLAEAMRRWNVNLQAMPGIAEDLFGTVRAIDIRG